MGRKFSLSGSKGCGKSTVAESLIAHSDSGMLRFSFQANLKNFLSYILLWDNSEDLVEEALYGDKDNTVVSTYLIDYFTVEYALKDLTNSKSVEDLTLYFINWWNETFNRTATGREVLQKVGTEFFRNQVSNSFWCDLMEFDINSLSSFDMVVDDTRFKDEIALLEKLGFTTINIVSNEISEDSHVSENDLKDHKFNCTFYNDKTKGTSLVDDFSSLMLGISNAK